MTIREQTTKVLNQVLELIKQLDTEQYSQLLPVLTDNSVGKHIRHIAEFYQCLLNGLSAGSIDYDKRERNILLETDIDYTCEAIKKIIHRIEIIQDNKLQLNVSYGDSFSVVETSVFRELTYNIEHTIHHLAIVKIGITTSFPEVILLENIGVSHSTIKFQEQQLLQK